MPPQTNDKKKKLQVPSDPAALKDAVTRTLTRPVDMVMLTADRIQAVLDDAVEHGRMTRDDAQEVAQELVTLGRSQTERVVGEIESLITGGRGQIESATRAAKGAAAKVMRKDDVTGEPFAGYDEMTADEAIKASEDLDPGSLREVRDYEKRNANRKTVLRAVEQKLSATK